MSLYMMTKLLIVEIKFGVYKYLIKMSISVRISSKDLYKY